MEFDKFRELALAFKNVVEKPHFNRTSFRINNKILATYDYKTKIAAVKLSLVNQDLYTLSNNDIVYPVPNKFGKQGWTFINLNNVKVRLIKEILKSAYIEVTSKNKS